MARGSVHLCTLPIGSRSNDAGIFLACTALPIASDHGSLPELQMLSAFEHLLTETRRLRQV